MKSYLSRLKNYIIPFLLLHVLIYSQAVKNGFDSQFNSIISGSFFTTSIIGLEVYDLTDKKTIVSKNEKLLLRPASNMKVLTSGAALMYLPDDYKFATNFYFDGSKVDSTFYGSIFVEGGFDPEYTDKDLDTVVLVLKKLGIKSIQGKILADISNTDSLYWGKGWMWDDNPSEFQPYITSLNINHNTVKIVCEPGKAGERAKVSVYPSSNYFTFDNSVKTIWGKNSDVDVTRDWINNSNKIVASGEISYKRRSDTTIINVLHPELYFITLLKEKLIQNDIKVIAELDTGTVTAASKLFLTQTTPMPDVLNNMNAESENLNAECFLRALAKEHFDPPYSAKKGLKMVDSLVWKLGYNPKNYVFADGCGLSFYNLVSAELITDMLKYFYAKQPEKYILLAGSFPLAGKNGTLENRMKYGPAFNNVKAKTGTISGVSSLSGYLTTKKNHILAFSILIQNFRGNATQPRNIQDKICELLIENY